MRRAIPFLVLAAGGCAYYNGVYNAKASAKTADRQFVRGESYAASQAYTLSATTAETVLVRHPRSRWRPEALYLAAFDIARSGASGKVILDWAGESEVQRQVVSAARPTILGFVQ